MSTQPCNAPAATSPHGIAWPAYGPWLFTLLDAQTAWWKDIEGHTARMLQPWLRPTEPSSSVYPLRDAAPRLGLSSPAAAQWAWDAWAGWTQVWVNALQHDASAT